jgi:hypothetical protein
MSNCPLCEVDFSTDDIIVLREHFVTAHSVDTGTAKILINLLQNQKIFGPIIYEAESDLRRQSLHGDKDR